MRQKELVQKDLAVNWEEQSMIRSSIEQHQSGIMQAEAQIQSGKDKLKGMSKDDYEYGPTVAMVKDAEGRIRMFKGHQMAAEESASYLEAQYQDFVNELHEVAAAEEAAHATP